MSKLKSFIVATQQRVGFWEMLIPIFMELLQGLMEQCANTEQQAVSMLTEPTPAQMRIMHRRMLLALHRDKSVPLNERNATAWQIVYAGIEQANADPDVVIAAFHEVKTAASPDDLPAPKPETKAFQ